MQVLPSSKTTLLLLSVAGLYGCGWVDSTGKQGLENRGNTGIIIPVTQFDSSVTSLQEGAPAALLENMANRTRLLNDNSSTRIWTWDLSDEGNDKECEDVDGFDTRYAAKFLQNACADPGQCDIRISDVSGPYDTEFLIQIPPLKAPVALTYRLSSELSDGGRLSRKQSVCALSVNEAPTTVNDAYRALAGETRIVNAYDPDNLLANDTDDVDTRNQPLHVDTRVITEPEYAKVFTLLPDGGFSYQSASDLPLDSNGKLIDSFTYTVSDGQHDVKATATISITADNGAPLAIGSLPDVQIDRFDVETDADFTLDAAPYFYDADNDPLVYSIDVGKLPDEVSVQISDEGILSIAPGSTFDKDISGSWTVNIIASDGLAKARSAILIDINATQAIINQAPLVDDIENRAVKKNFEYDISVFFSDPDGDELTFSTGRLPEAVSLSPDGVLSGKSKKNNRGTWFIVVEAFDGFGGSASDGFLLIIK